MTVAKETEPNSVRYKMAPFKNDCGQKISHPSSASYKMAPFKDDCGQKKPNQTVQASKKHLSKMTVEKNRTKLFQVQNGTF